MFDLQLVYRLFGRMEFIKQNWVEILAIDFIIFGIGHFNGFLLGGSFEFTDFVSSMFSGFLIVSFFLYLIIGRQ